MRYINLHFTYLLTYLLTYSVYSPMFMLSPESSMFQNIFFWPECFHGTDRGKVQAEVNLFVPFSSCRSYTAATTC